MQSRLQSKLTLRVKQEIKRVAGQIQTWDPVDPEYIIWKNIGYSGKSRRLRRAVSILVATTIILFSVVIIYEFGEQKAALFEKVGPGDCGIVIDKELAYKSQITIMERNPQDAGIRHDFMACFCDAELLGGGFTQVQEL
jgi:hypothetical protein